MIPELSPSEFKEVATFFQNLAVNQGYDLLTKKGPKGFTKNFDVIKLVNTLIKHFEKSEDYEKCAKLLKVGDEYRADKLVKKLVKDLAN